MKNSENASLTKLQDKWISSKLEYYFWKLYVEVQGLISVRLGEFCASCGLRFTAEEREDFSAEMTLRLMMRYRKNEGYKVRGWRQVFDNEIRHALHYPPKRKADELIDRAAVVSDIVIPEVVEFAGDEKKYIEKLSGDAAIDGKRIVRDIYCTQLKCRAGTRKESHLKKEYETAIKRISEYTEKKKIYQYARELKAVFDMTRRKDGA
jgi:hypothetical protein